MYWTGELFSGKHQRVQSLMYQPSSPTISTFQGLLGEHSLGELWRVWHRFLTV